MRVASAGKLATERSSRCKHAQPRRDASALAPERTSGAGAQAALTLPAAHPGRAAALERLVPG